ncbi:hypothetical protein A3Q56_04837 [Intoshia linei]|uniref:Uncharacterized protein n=1 Tax=Intoshia linei TaxID=1819745 RepID=A0A177AZK6_9BILA|nr:hypothetical protein A3Q56_04837 [Intoshia linei]
MLGNLQCLSDMYFSVLSSYDFNIATSISAKYLSSYTQLTQDIFFITDKAYEISDPINTYYWANTK